MPSTTPLPDLALSMSPDLSGPHWTLSYQTSAGLHAATGSDASNVWIVGDSSSTARWNGMNWSAGTVSAPSPTVLNTVWLRSPTEVWAAGQYGRVFKWNGTMWSNLQAGGADHNASWGRGTGELFEAGDDTNYVWNLTTGNTFNPNFFPGTKLYGAWGNGTAILFVGDTNRIIRIPTGTNTPTADTVSGPASNFRGVFGLSDQQQWAVGSGGVVATASRSAWVSTVVTGATSGSQLNAIWGSSANDLWVVGNAGVILHYDGAQWSPSPAASVTGYDLVAIWGADAQNIWLVGNKGTSQGAIFRY